MKKRNLQAGFAPLVIIAIIAILAIGGGAYVVKKNRAAKLNIEDNIDTQANANADANANINANLGINANAKAKGTFRSLLALGKNTQCSFTGVNKGVTSSGTVYITAGGNMRGDFSTTSTSGAKTSNMIVKDGTAYVWSGTQGAKMSTAFMGGANAQAQAQSQQGVDLNSQVDYTCKDWTVDQSKFTLPSGVKFIDIEAMFKAAGGVKLGQ